MAKIRKGQIIKNTNGRSYKVLATKTNWYGRQNLLVKDTKTNSIIKANSWYPEHKSTYGTWYSGTYYGVVSPYKQKKILKKFKSNK